VTQSAQPTARRGAVRNPQPLQLVRSCHLTSRCSACSIGSGRRGTWPCCPTCRWPYFTRWTYSCAAASDSSTTAAASCLTRPLAPAPKVHPVVSALQVEAAHSSSSSRLKCCWRCSPENHSQSQAVSQHLPPRQRALLLSYATCSAMAAGQGGEVRVEPLEGDAAGGDAGAKRHLVVLVNGLFGSVDNWDVVVECLQVCRHA
jgi:hypothetical protein